MTLSTMIYATANSRQSICTQYLMMRTKISKLIIAPPPCYILYSRQNSTQKKVEELKRIKDAMFACQGAKCKPEQNSLRSKPTRHKTGPGRGGRFRQTALVASDSGSRPFPRRIKPNRGRRGERQRHKNNKMSKGSTQPAYVPITFFERKHF